MKNDQQWNAFKSSLTTDKPVDSIAAMSLPLDVEKLREQYPDTPKVASANERMQSEVSADARYIAGRIIKHLWILLFVMPVIAMILYAVVTAK